MATTDSLSNVVSTVVLAGMTLEMIKRIYPSQYEKERLRRQKVKKVRKAKTTKRKSKKR